MISSQMLSSRWAFSAITYSGPIAATTGSILVEMKKNSESRHPATGRIDSAYAAGSASTITRMVEPTVATAECSMNGPKPLKTSRNSLSVGLKVNLGGQVSEADSGLNAVTTIDRIGMKKAIPPTQPSTVQPACPEISLARRLRLGAWAGAWAGASVTAVIS